MKNTEAKKKRGRPQGRSQKGEAQRENLYNTALGLFESTGYEDTTMRMIATEAGVSPGLLYRYFPSKIAVVMSLYDQLSGEYADRMMGSANSRGDEWHPRFVHALRSSLEVLSPYRNSLVALTPTLVGSDAEGVLSDDTEQARERVRGAFIAAVRDSQNAPDRETALALGALLYLAHLGVVLFWLLDKSEDQDATWQLLEYVEDSEKFASLGVNLPFVRKAIRQLSEVVTAAF